MSSHDAYREEPANLIAGLSGEFNLKYGLRLLWVGKSWIIVIALLGLGVGFLATFLQVPIYSARALVQIDPPGQNISQLSNPYPTSAFNYFDYRNYYNTQYRIIRSKSLGKRSIEKLDLADEPPFRDAKEPGRIFVSRVRVVPIPDTRLAQIVVEHEDPREAARWANTLAESYIEQNLESKIETTRNVYSWLQERLAAAEGDVKSSENSLYEYTKQQDLFVPTGGQSIGARTLTRLNEEATEAKTRRIEIESGLAQVDKLKQSGGTLDALPQIAADPLVQRLNISKADLEVERVQLKNRYKEGHPKVKKVVTQIEQLQDAINAQAEKIVAGMRADYQQLRRRERELLASINSQRKESIEDSRKTVQLEMLQREALSNKSLYEAILQKIKETDVASSLRENNVSIIERASVPVIPIRPQPTKTLTIALVLGLLSGCGLILLRDYLDNTLKAQDDVERHLHADCLAIVPKHDAASESIITEAYRTLRTSLLFTREREHGNMILVTSSIPRKASPRQRSTSPRPSPNRRRDPRGRFRLEALEHPCASSALPRARLGRLLHTRFEARRRDPIDARAPSVSGDIGQDPSQPAGAHRKPRGKEISRRVPRTLHVDHRGRPADRLGHRSTASRKGVGLGADGSASPSSRSQARETLSHGSQTDRSALRRYRAQRGGPEARLLSLLLQLLRRRTGVQSGPHAPCAKPQVRTWRLDPTGKPESSAAPQMVRMRRPQTPRVLMSG